MDFLGVALLVSAGLLTACHFFLFVILFIMGITGGGAYFIIIAIVNLAFTAIYSGVFMFILDN